VKIAALDTKLSVNVLYHKLIKSPPFDRADARIELNRRFNEIPGVKIPERTAEAGSWCGIHSMALAPEAAQKQFVEVLDWVAARLAEPTD
jgi:hypothetical protein